MPNVFFIIFRFDFIPGLSKSNTEELTAAAKNFMIRFTNEVDSSLVSEYRGVQFIDFLKFEIPFAPNYSAC